MLNKTNTQTEYQVGTKIDLTATSTNEQDTLTKLKNTLKLEIRMFTYDTLHRTNYRKVRHAIVARERNEAFEKSIGLVRVTTKKR